MRTWTITNHLCRTCGGRILKTATGAGVTPGGNPIFKCPDCGLEKSDLMPDILCWCGFHYKHNRKNPYQCLPFSVLKTEPAIEPLFRANGCDPTKGEVGIILNDSLRKLRQ